MTTFEKVLAFLLTLAVAIIGVLVLTYLIKYFFILLGFFFNHPAEAMIATIIIGISWISLPIGKERQ